MDCCNFFKSRLNYPHHMKSRSKLTLNTSNINVAPISVTAREFVSSAADKGSEGKIRLYLKHVCKSSSLHGLQYFVDYDRPVCERYLWAITVLLVIGGMFVTVMSQTYAYFNYQIIMSLNGEVTPVWEIPFPALTFCTDNQVPPSLINITELNLTSEIRNLTEYEKIQLDLAAYLCMDSNRECPVKRGKHDYNSSLNLQRAAAMFTAKLCKKYMKNLVWRSDFHKDVCSLVQVSSVGMKLCHSFNMLPPLGFYSDSHLRGHINGSGALGMSYPYKYTFQQTSWSPEKGFENENDNIVLRLPGNTLRNSANFLLDFCSDDIQVDCYPRSSGFKVIVHNPAERPSLLHTSAYAEVDKRTMLQLLPTIIRTDDNLRDWKPDKRGCYFSHERALKFYRIYTSTNCYSECEANITLQECGCNDVNQPRFPSVSLCGPDEQNCVLESLLNSGSANYQHHGLAGSCNCLPSCNELTYDVKIIVQPRNWTYNTIAYNIPPNETKMNSYASVTVFYRSPRVNTIVRVKKMALSDLIADIGSLKSLFLGFTFLSMFEIFYYCSLRWITDVLQRNGYLKKT